MLSLTTLLKTPLTMIDLKQIEKCYQTGANKQNVLDGISLTIKQGEFVAIMGPSGSGKSTLLNIIGMLDKVSAGQYRFMQQIVSDQNESALARLRKTNIGFIFQDFNLIDELTVEENIELALLYQNINRKTRADLVAKVMDNVGLAHRADYLPSQLSGGQQQRVAVARAIVGKQPLLLADEPTGNLDSQQGKDVMNILKRLHQDGATIVMVTHSAQHAEYASRILHLFDGKIVNQSQKHLHAS